MSSSTRSADLYFLRPEILSTLGTNGGKPTKIADPTPLFAGFSPDPSEMLAGANRFRKIYYGLIAGKTWATVVNGTTVDPANLDQELIFKNPIVTCRSFNTPGFNIFFLTQGATLKEQFESRQSDIPINTAGIPTGRILGAGYLTQSASLGDSTIIVDAQNGSLKPFQTGDLVCFSKDTWTEITGTPLWRIVTGTTTGQNPIFETISATAVTYLNNAATIQLASPLNYALPRRSFVSVGIKTDGYITNHADPVVVTRGSGNASSGTYNDSDYPLIVHPQGGIAQQWTLSFTSNYAYTCTGDTVGSVAGGNINSDFTPINPKHNMPYFTLKSSGFQGTWQAGDTVSFYTFTQVIVFWLYLALPPNTEPMNNITFNIAAFN